MLQHEQDKLRKVISELHGMLVADEAGLSSFIEKNLVSSPGGSVLFALVYRRFLSTLPIAEHFAWSRVKFARHIRKRFAVHNGQANKLFLMNVVLSGENEC